MSKKDNTSVSSEKSSDDAAKIIEHTQFSEGVYILGSYENRITLYSQQVRALNLIHALIEQGGVKPESKIAIVGGGAAGITACAGLVLHGCKKVTVFEKSSDVLGLWGTCYSNLVSLSKYFVENSNCKSILPASAPLTAPPYGSYSLYNFAPSLPKACVRLPLAS